MSGTCQGGLNEVKGIHTKRTVPANHRGAVYFNPRCFLLLPLGDDILWAGLG